MLKLLFIDHDDSFSYNLKHAFEVLGAQVDFISHTQLSSYSQQAVAQNYTHLCFSPGPGSPQDYPTSCKWIQDLSDVLPILGVCLGMQMMVSAFGGQITKAPFPVHGTAFEIQHEASGIFQQTPMPFVATRYHSLVVDSLSLPKEWKVCAWLPSGEVMGVEHRSLPLYGVQFHPESILTQAGPSLLKNFLKMSTTTPTMPNLESSTQPHQYDLTSLHPS